jgi:hypothetical protein
MVFYSHMLVCEWTVFQARTVRGNMLQVLANKATAIWAPEPIPPKLAALCTDLALELLDGPAVEFPLPYTMRFSALNLILHAFFYFRLLLEFFILGPLFSSSLPL